MTRRKVIPSGLALPQELYDKIEESRGHESRSSFLVRMLQEGFEHETHSRVLSAVLVEKLTK